MSRHYQAHPGYDEGPRRTYRFFLYVLMLVLAVSFGGFVWQLYSGPSAPLISPPAGAYKTEPAPEAANLPDPVEQDVLFDTAEGPIATTPATPQTTAAAAAAGPPQLAPTPSFAANGAYLAQLAALESEAGVDSAWRRLSSRAPDLFSQARLDVERADLGPRGVYFRVRAGYFADRANATRFCERVRQMRQDCIVVSR